MARRRPAKTTAKKAAAKREDAVSRPFAALARKVAKKAAVEPPARERGPRRPAAKDDEASFAVHMRDVKPLDARRTRVSATGDAASAAAAPKQAAPPPDADDAAREELGALFGAGLRFELVDDGTLLEGRRLDVDPRELRRLRRQSYAVDGKLDLHGHDAHGAKAAVERFVERRRSQGDRAVLIVHGKGRHSPRGAAVLRGELGAWLSQGVAAKDVLAFASLEDADGGSGALMVLLAKR